MYICIYIYFKLYVEDEIRIILKLKSQKIAKYFVVRNSGNSGI